MNKVRLFAEAAAIGAGKVFGGCAMIYILLRVCRKKSDLIKDFEKIVKETSKEGEEKEA